MEMRARSSYPLLSLLRHYAPNTRDSRTACTFRMWQCKLYTYTIDVLVLMSSRDLEQRDLIISIDIPRNQYVHLSPINDIRISVYIHFRKQNLSLRTNQCRKDNRKDLPCHKLDNDPHLSLYSLPLAY